jgi:hypothetical protein
MPFEATDTIAALALGLSAYATWQTLKFNERQKSLIESQERLNQRLLQREDIDERAGKQADLSAAFIKLGTSRYRLRICNKGKSTARNVQIEFPDGNDCFIEDDVKSKFPLEALAQHQSVDLIAAVGPGTKRKQTISLLWADDLQTHNLSTLYLTI